MLNIFIVVIVVVVVHVVVVVVASARFATVLGNGDMYGSMAIDNCFNMLHDCGIVQ